MIILRFPNLDVKSQFVLGKYAIGVPFYSNCQIRWSAGRVCMLTQLSVLISCAPELTSDGVVVPFRDQNQTRMNCDVRSTAYQPPPYVLNTGPYDDV